MSTSASAILDGLLAQVQAIGAFGSANVTKGDYAVLDTTTTGYAVVCRFHAMDLEPEAFDDDEGANNTATITYHVDGYIKFQNDELTYQTRPAAFVDQLRTKVDSDRTLGGVCDDAILQRAEELTVDFDLKRGDQRYKLVRATVVATKYAE